MTLSPRAQFAMDSLQGFAAEHERFIELLRAVVDGHQMTTVDGLALVHVPADVIAEIRRVLGT